MRKVLFAAAAGAAFIAVAACSSGGGGGPANQIKGSVGGNTIVPVSAIFDSPFVIGTSGNISTAVAYMSDSPDLCNELLAGNVHANSTLVQFLIGNFTGSAITPPAGTGVYDVYPLITATTAPSANFIGALYTKLDANCGGSSNPPEMQSGSFNINKLSATEIAGKGTHIGWSTGEDTTVSIDFQECAGLVAALQSTSATCVQ